MIGYSSVEIHDHSQLNYYIEIHHGDTVQHMWKYLICLGNINRTTDLYLD